jgi:crotonobetainyl-CoA:carnitine CoA-transferase CaiB-like acyl-CoA transferase
VVENMATGVMDRLGLGYPTLRERNPRLVMASSQLLGDRGAWSHWKGYGPSARAIGGLTWLWEHPAVEPREGVSTIHPDHFAGRLLALATVAALHARDRTGMGCHVDMAQAEVVVGLLGDLFLAESLQPGSVGPVGNASDAGAPWGAYRCRDDGTTESWVAICVRTDDEWRALRKIMGEPAWSLADRFETTAGRQGARDELDASLNAWTATRENREVMRELQAAGVPAGALLHPRTQMDDPHFQARDFFRIIEQPGTGRVIVDGPAFHGAALGEPDIRPAPLPGEHTREICRDDLGLDDAEIAALIERGVIDAAAAPPVL